MEQYVAIHNVKTVMTDLFHMLYHYCIQTSVWSGLKYHIRGQDCACDYRKHF